MNRTYHTDGTLPKDNEYFVFGSNTSGVHGIGGAKVARFLFNAKMGESEGITGHSYAIPTRKYLHNAKNFVTLEIEIVRKNIKTFCEFTKEKPDWKWWVTRVGCGYAGFNNSQIAPCFKEAINCSFPIDWQTFLE